MILYYYSYLLFKFFGSLPLFILFQGISIKHRDKLGAIFSCNKIIH